MSFTVTLTTVAMMLLYAVPGYLLMKGGLLKKDSISAFAAVLLYLCSPFQTLYAMQQIEYSPYMVRYLLISLALGIVLMGGVLALLYFLTRKKQVEVPWRICISAAVMGNCGFMGIPLLEALMPHYPQAVGFTSMFFVSYNILMWTLVSFIITRNKKFISIKKIALNPSVIAMYFALILFFGRIRLTGQIADMVTLLSKMCTPLCMLILGMRLALVPIKPMFTSKLQYATIALKLIVFPLIALAICSILPVERDFAVGMYIICCAPVGNMVLSFAELLGEGQDTAANVVILSTILSMITIPVMLLLV